MLNFFNIMFHMNAKQLGLKAEFLRLSLNFSHYHMVTRLASVISTVH